MQNNVKRIFKLNKWIDGQSGYIFNTVLTFNKLAELLVLSHSIAQFADATYKIGMRLKEIGFALCIRSVKQCSISKNESCRDNCFVTVFVCTATHARSIVLDNSSYHGRFYRSGIGRKPFSEGFQDVIYTLSYNTGL